METKLNPKPQPDLLALTGVRAYAALWVYLAHLHFMPAYDGGFGNKFDLGMFTLLLRADFMAVDFFFVISGFVLYRHYKDYFTFSTRGWKLDKFLLLRVSRLWPMHILAIGMIGFYHWAGIPHPLQSGLQDGLLHFWPITLPLNAMMMQSWGIVPAASWNEPAWTVSAMFFVYLVFPTAIMLVQVARKTCWQVVAIILLLMALEAVPRFVEGVRMADGIGAMLRAFTLFMTGCFCYRLYADGWLNSVWSDAVFLLCFIIAVGLMMLFISGTPFPLILVHIFYPLMILALANARGGVRMAFVNRPALWIGKLSYSIYILHYPYLLLVKYFYGATLSEFDHPLALVTILIIVTAVFIALCWVCYRTIESPVYRFVQNKLGMEKGPKPGSSPL
jgi:peptidoglycan/LPS O-acetylase OafA/YrhL